MAWRTAGQPNSLSRMELDPEAEIELLSSGMKRRVLRARALVSNPDLLLLDESTNHLEIDVIDWLEKILSRWNGSLVFLARHGQTSQTKRPDDS